MIHSGEERAISCCQPHRIPWFTLKVSKGNRWKKGPSARGLQTVLHSKTGTLALLRPCAPAFHRCALRRRQRSRRRCCYTLSAACTRSALVRSKETNKRTLRPETAHRNIPKVDHLLAPWLQVTNWATPALPSRQFQPIGLKIFVTPSSSLNQPGD